MAPLVLFMVSFGLVLSACSRRGDARVRLNSISTVILSEGHALPVNRSAWGPSLDLTLYQCMSDLECSEGSFCHVSMKGTAHSRCRTCRKRKKRCQRDGMCCPGNRCSKNICVPDVAQRILHSEEGRSPPSKEKGWRKRARMNVRGVHSKGQVGDPCLRSSDCSAHLCCARHFWTRICKPVLHEGQVCTRHRRKGSQGLELFQRCPCGEGLSCQMLKERSTKPSSSSSSSSSLMAAVAKSRFAPSSSSSSSSKSSSSAVAKTRLHICQKK
uniref:Uncharacterized protein n=1 Tax=Monopterus albus TaxID=43700 RepID=A0A3Q3IUH2_MONAL|nr:dickkopf-related protein 2-like [Monopterus albus]